MKIQIYGHDTLEDALMSVQSGVDFIGVVTGELGRIPNEVSYAGCQDIFSGIPKDSTVSKVVLTISDDINEIVETVSMVSPDVIHLSGQIEDMPVAKVAQLKQHVFGTKIMQAIPVTDATTIDLALKYQGVCDYIILDTNVESEVGDIGATGATHDWTVSRRIVNAVNIPVILAGGLGVANVTEAISIVRPWCVDSFTHTNIPNTYVNDPDKVKSFVDAARSYYE
ncbi:MAG: N-(5'-phosphoribosyl)anthranilate isomerase [Anaerolineaceae bacterium]|nr:N-(5'-phosphoribosyl)anthranilate isomerase [Anaerolineaceae bacterium]